MSTFLWTRDEVIAATGGKAFGPDWSATGVSIDSRTAAPADIFVAITGDRFDGHGFVAQALAGGVAAAIVNHRPAGVPDAMPLVIVPDTLAALRALAERARARTHAKLVGVTGSVGKTGTKEMLGAALAAFGATHVNAGNLNNHFGAPLSLARMPATTEFAVQELGMNHAGEISPLSVLARPDVAIITNVEPVHIEFFESEDGIAEAKCEILDGLTPDGAIVLNADNRWYDYCRAAARKHGTSRIVSFGRAEQADARLISVEVTPEGSRVKASIGGTALTYRLDAVGEHWAINSLGVLACIDAFGLDVHRAAKEISRVTAGRGRGAQVRIALAEGGSFLLIDESYNASPPAMRAAFQVMAMSAPEPGARRIAVLGDMRELGNTSAELHAGLAGDLMATRADAVFTVGPFMRELRAELPEHMLQAHGEISQDIAGPVAASVNHGDVVLVKGSLGTNMAPIVTALRALSEPPAMVVPPMVVNGH